MTEEMDSFFEGVINKCDRLYDKGEKEEALKCIISAGGKYKDKASLLNHYRVMLLSELGRTGEAIKIADELVQEEPDNPLSYGVKGICLFKMGKLDEALKFLKIALKFNPNIHEFNFLAFIVITAKTAKNSPEADAYLNKAMELNPSLTVSLLKDDLDKFLKKAKLTNEETMRLKTTMANLEKKLQRLEDLKKKMIKSRKK